MIKTFCMYQQKYYELDCDDMTCVIYGDETDRLTNSFSEYVDVLGNIHGEISYKEVDQNELEDAFEACILMMYQGEMFEVWSIGKARDNEVILVTNNEVTAKKYDFIKKEQFVFYKSVELVHITKIIEQRRGILRFIGNNSTKELKIDELYNRYA